MESMITNGKSVYMEIGNEKANITSTAAFFQQLAKCEGMESSQALLLRFALENLFNFIFSFLTVQEEDMGRVKIWASFEKDALCLVIHEWGIPILAEEVPDITVEDLFNKDFQPPTLLDQPETVYNGFGIHFIKKSVNEFSMLYSHDLECYEICIKQFFVQPINNVNLKLPIITEHLHSTSPSEEIIDMGNGYTFKRLSTLKEAIQVIRGTIETYGYGVQRYNLPTDINNYLSMVNKGTYFPYIIIGEDNFVIHHFAYHQCDYNPRYIEACHQFARPRFRGRISPMKVMSAVSHLPLIQNYEGLYAMCVSMHIITQLGALRNGYHITGFTFDKLHVELHGTHRDSPEFFCLVETHKTIHPRDRELYVPQKYREIVQSIYTELQLPVIFKESNKKLHESTGQSQFIIEVDGKFCRSLILLHPKAGDWENIRKEVTKVRIKGIQILRLSISAEDLDCIELAKRLDELDFIFTGISPINDLLVFHYFNGINIDFNQIKLVHDFGRPLLKIIETEYKRIFPL